MYMYTSFHLIKIFREKFEKLASKTIVKQFRGRHESMGPTLTSTLTISAKDAQHAKNSHDFFVDFIYAHNPLASRWWR